MPVASEDVWRVLYEVSRYLFPLLAAILVIQIFIYILSEGRIHREKARSLPGFGTVGELVVLSGSRELDPNTWFPVPREGVLGSVRSCDLVIPCAGVHTKHLDFSWKDGLGLVIRPRSGCEVYINGVSVTCRMNPDDIPLTHGSVLQVGSAVLRLHLFAALDNTSAPVQQPEHSEQSPSSVLADPTLPFTAVPVSQGNPIQPAQSMPSLQFRAVSEMQPVQETPASAGTERSELRHSDHWEEDFGE